jgi:L-lactate dehydrogenase complex protein LldF
MDTILSPKLPYTIPERAKAASRDLQLQQFVHHATRVKDTGRRSVAASAFGDRYDDLRRHAGAIKQHTLEHLDRYLDQWITSAQAAGTKVHFAKDAAEANAIVLAIAAAANATLCVKAKSMATEETALVPALEASGVKTVETDLGEFILQLDGDAPSHIVTPMIHKDRTAVGRAFTRELHARYTEEPSELTAIARAHMRDLFERAATTGIGISGANFLLPDTGSLVLCTNEGNADLSVLCPNVHIALVGIEKLIPSAAHLPIFLKLLARSATAQPITVYTTTITGPRRATEQDGPREMHVVLLDNGRVDLLASEARELLRCIRCGACLNACPVYRKVGGGHAYGAVYSGPIGAVLTPHLKGVENYPDLPRASSLCGACFEACPVHIDIPRELIRLRQWQDSRHLTPLSERLAMKAWAWTLASPARYRAASAAARWFMNTAADSTDAAGRRWLSALPGPLAGWTARRQFPAPAPRSFRDWWASRKGPQS